MRGGKRAGAGRPTGAKNVQQTARQEAAAKAAEGIMPLDYMLSVMRDETAESDRRERMAIAAAPYLHPKLLPKPPEDGNGNQSVVWTLGLSITGRYGLTDRALNSINSMLASSDGRSLLPIVEQGKQSPALPTSSSKPASSQGSD